MKPGRWHSCTVLESGPAGRRAWQFTASGNRVAAAGECAVLPSEKLPAQITARGWRSLWRRRLNIARLPGDQVFLRAIHLPRCDPGELKSMVELQLEKLSPLPVSQIVWSFEAVPDPVPVAGEQTLLVVIAGRAAIEERLGQLEAAGYYADLLEVSMLGPLLATPPGEDGTWIFLTRHEARLVALTAWWYGGRLRHLQLVPLADDAEAVRILCAALDTAAWAGEVAGWLARAPAWNLVADASLAAEWETRLAAWAGQPLRAERAADEVQQATLSAQRALPGEPRVNLLPEEHAVRYRQEFIDSLWMRGLFAATLLYLAGVLVYLGAVRVLAYQKQRIDGQVAALNPAYTNALQLKARIEVLQEQNHLKFAALDCWKTMSELLPEDVTLLQFNFQSGKTLNLQGTALAEAQKRVTDFNSELRKATNNGRILFGEVGPPSISLTPGQGSEQLVRWSFVSELKRSPAP